MSRNATGRYRNKQIAIWLTEEEKELIYNFIHERDITLYQLLINSIKYQELKEKEEKIRKMLEES